MSTLSQSTLDKLATFDTPTICNIVELFEVRPHSAGYMDARIQARFPEMPPMVGFAATATVRSAAAPGGDGSYDWLSEHVAGFAELPGPAVVVFQDLDDPHVAATFGEVMCTTYQALGAVGLVSSGAARDLDQVRALGFPVFTDGVICSHGFFHATALHIPVNVGGIVINPGDLLHADCNGVATIPVEIAAAVAQIGDEFMAAEQVILDAMRGGAPSVEKLRAARGEAHARISRLRARVAGAG